MLIFYLYTGCIGRGGGGWFSEWAEWGMMSRDDSEVGIGWERCAGGCRRSTRCAIVCVRASVKTWDAALCWSLWSSGWGLAYVSQEHGDICVIIYSQQIRWEAQGLLREGIIWEPKDQPGHSWALRTFSGKKAPTNKRQLFSGEALILSSEQDYNEDNRACAETSIY